ncbi:MAG: TIGR02099 family protein [Gammaproteobacteria bacterium]|nr:TIGR02099 family protein [Gammaproteobacteria bacterium]
MHALKKTFLRILIYSLVSIALLVTFLRLGLVWVLEHPAGLEKYLSRQLHASVHIHSILTDWDKSNLTLILQNVQIEEFEGTPLASLKKIGLVIDMLSTLKHFRWQITQLLVEELEWTIYSSPETNPISWEKWTSLGEWLSHQPHWVFKNIKLAWHQAPNDPPIIFFIPQLGRDKENSLTRLSGALHIQSSRSNGVLQFGARLRGELAKPSTLQGDFFIQGNPFALAALNTLFSIPFTGKTGLMNFTLWGTLHASALQIISTVSFHNLSFLTEQHKTITLPQGEMDVFFHAKKKTEWALKVSQRQLKVNQTLWPESFFEVRKALQAEKPHFWFMANYLDFNAIRDLVPLFSKKWINSTLLQFMQEGKPSGIIRGLTLSFSDCHAPEVIQAQFQDLKLSPFRDFPGFSGIRGEIKHEHDRGMLKLHHRDLTVHFPHLFRGPLSFSQVNGKTVWHKQDKTWLIQTPFLSLKNRDIELAAQFQLTVPKGGQTELNLLAQFTNINGSHHARYLPVHIMDKALVAWLEASIAKASISSGRLVFRGPLSRFPFTNHTGVFEVLGQIKDLTLNYDPAWPNIQNGKGELAFTGQGMQVLLTEGNIANTSVQKVSAVIPNFLLDNPLLSIDSQIIGDSSDGIRFLRKYVLPEKLDSINLKGPFELALGLDIPLGEETTPTQVRGKATLGENQLTLEASPASLDHLKGILHFTADTIASESLSGELFQEPVRLTLSMLPIKKNMLEAMLAGTLDSKKFSAHLPENTLLKQLFQKMDGKTEYRATFQFKDNLTDTKAISTRLSLHSDLKGLALHLPSPLTKTEAEQGLLSIEGNLKENKASTLHLKVKINEQSPAFSLNASLTPTKNILKTSIQGRFPSIDLWEWVALLPEKQKLTLTSPKVHHTIEVRDLLFEKVKLGSRHFPSVHVGITPSSSAWTFSLKSPELLGFIELPVHSSPKPIQFNFERLHVPTPIMGATKRSPSTMKLKPSGIPKLEGHIAQLVLDGKEIGAIALTTNPTTQGILFQATLDRKDISSTALDGFWTQHEGRSHTQLKGKLHSNNLAQDLKLWNLETGIEESIADIGFNWEWKGNPGDFDIEKIKGEMTVALKNGRLTDISLGPSRILGLLSIQALKRRLTLDFKDLYQKGLAFDTFNGTFKLKEGNAYTCDTVLVGPSTHITLQGRTGFAARDYHQVAYVALDLTGSLPFIVGAFNPIAGAATWVGNKLLEEQVNKLTRFQYTMTGPWDNPNITVTKAPTLFKPWEIIPELLPPFLTGGKKQGTGEAWCIP